MAETSGMPEVAEQFGRDVVNVLNVYPESIPGITAGSTVDPVLVQRPYRP